jgi:hypothetical protein
MVDAMDKDPEIVAQEIAEMVGGRIDFHEDEVTGECHASIETDDHGDAKGDGPDRKSAFASLVGAAEDVGWDPPEPIYP